MATSANCRLVARLPRTAFQKGRSGNPNGRARGTRNKATVEARELATRLIDDPEYRDRLRKRLLAGSAGPIELMLWQYAHGKPPERLEITERSRFREMTNEELSNELLDAYRRLRPFN